MTTCAIRLLGLCVCFLCVSMLGRSPIEQATAKAGTASEHCLIQAGAKYSYLANAVELPSSRYVRIALHDLDAGRNSGAGAVRPKAIAKANHAGAGWPVTALKGPRVRQGDAPFGTDHAGQGCNCQTQIGDSSKERLAVLYLQRRFDVPISVEPTDHQILALRVDYRDGVKAFLNGHLIASRNLPLDTEKQPVAKQTRGPEWEEFYVPVSPNLLRRTGNVLGFEVRPAARRHGVRFDAELTLRDAKLMGRGPIVQQVREHSALIAFDMELPTAAIVEYGATRALGATAVSARNSLVRHHQVRLLGLTPGQVVYYRVVVGGKSTETYSFHVPASRREPLHFAVYGDVRGGHRVHSQIVSDLLEEMIDFVVVTGDLVTRGSDEADWQRFFSVTGPLLARIPYYPVPGNHDVGASGDEGRQMKDMFSLWPGPKNRPASGYWHSFDTSGVHFVMLDSNHYRDEEQLRWLETDLRKNSASQSRATFVVVHAGPYSRGVHQGNTYAIEHYVPLLKKYNVSLLFSGHDHLYQRGVMGGVDYIVSGGGGAPLYSVQCGVEGKKPCAVDDGMQHVASEYHYILVTVYPNFIRVCPKRINKTPLESCIDYRLQ